MTKPIVYLQSSDGEEIELEVLTPDPADGTFTCHLPEGTEWPKDPLAWVRIVPQ